MTEQLDSSALSAALSHLACQTTAVSAAPPLVRPIRARLSPESHFWNQSLKSPNTGSDWYPLTGYRIFPQSDSHQNGNDGDDVNAILC